MQGIKATKPRSFDVIFVCEECKEAYEVGVEMQICQCKPLEQITVYLSMYKPFCCEKCGCDELGIQTWTEVQ